jgi:hypothetical protein
MSHQIRASPAWLDNNGRDSGNSRRGPGATLPRCENIPELLPLNFQHHSISQTILIRPLSLHLNNGPEIDCALSQLEELVGEDIHLDIVHSLGRDAVGYSILTLYLRDARCVGLMDLEDAPDDGQKPDDSDQAILAALCEQPFASIRELSRLTHVSNSVVH